MSTSNVRDIECLDSFKTGLIRLAADWDSATQEIRMSVHRIEEYFKQERPAYWRRQTQLAERYLTEAKDNLSRKRAATRPGDSAPATEAAQRVIRAERRLRVCQEKERVAKAWSIEMSQQCEELLGPLADMSEHCQTLLPEAARELGGLVEKLRLYAELGNASSGSRPDSTDQTKSP